MRRLRVAHVITGLGAGGAESMLVNLVGRLDRSGFSSEVVSLLEGGVNAQRLRAMGVPVRELGMTKGLPNPLAISRLHRWLRRAPPDLVQTWMYHADLVGGLAACSLPRTPVVWGVHSSTLPPHAKLATRGAVRASALLSASIPARIVVCSRTGLEYHADLGYERSRMVLIQNGVDVERYRPDASVRAEVRRELGASDDEVLIGLPARYAPEKDHRTFLSALGSVRRTYPLARAVLCGEGAGEENAALEQLAREYGLTGHALVRLGRRDDMPRLLCALDVACLSSSHVEAFSIALCEAMAAGVACAGTDVGDTAHLLGDPDLVAPPKDPAALAAVLRRLVAMGPLARRQLGAELRRRVSEHFSLESCVERYALLYRNVAGQSH